MPMVSVLALLTLVATACAPADASAAEAAVDCSHPEPVATLASPVVVVGLAGSPGTALGASLEAGLRAALSDVNDYSRLQFQVALGPGSPGDGGDTARRLVCESGAFLIAAPVGENATLGAVQRLRGLRGHSQTPVPIVGALSNSRVLRTRAGVRGADGRAGVVNVRVGGAEELRAVAMFLSRDLDAFNRTAIALGGSSFGPDGTGHIRRELANLGARPWALVSARGLSDAAVVDGLLRPENVSAAELERHPFPYAVVLVETGERTERLIRGMLGRGAAGVMFVCGSNPDERSAHVALSAQTRAELLAANSTVHLVQHMPRTTAHSALNSAFLESMNRSGSPLTDSTALEGYVVGRLIAMAATRSLEIYGWPLTRRTFLDTVFRSYRTFDLRGVVFGPYGDGVPPQTGDDWCNQGAHDLFIDRLDLATGELVQEPSSSVRFGGCTTTILPGKKRVLVGLSLALRGEQGTLDSMANMGLNSALLASNSARTSEEHMIVASNARSPNSTANIERLKGTNQIAVVGLNAAAALCALPLVAADRSSLAMIAPLSGNLSLRYPFQRNVINIVPLTLQEADAAVHYIATQRGQAVSSIGVVYSSNAIGREYRDAVVAAAIKYGVRNATYGFVAPFDGPRDGLLDEDAYIFAGEPSDAALFLKHLYASSSSTRNRTKMICSEVPQDQLLKSLGPLNVPREALSGVHVMSKTPPLSSLSLSSPLRQQYEQWVSVVDRGESSFRGFFVGMFLSAIVNSIDDSVPDPGEASEDITTDKLVNAVYKKQMFDVLGVSVGPFSDSCKEPGSHCCNQGLGTVYISKWKAESDAFSHVDYKGNNVSQCGIEWEVGIVAPHDSNDTTLGLTLALAFSLGVLALFGLCMLFVVYWYSKRTLSFLNIRRSDLEINQRISDAEGRLGVVHMGDWNGTTVAIRVIDKKDITKQELAAIKDVIALMHKLHHPNLLMLMGFCETPAELIVVCEYMSGGSLKDFLAKNRGQLGIFALIAIAYDAVKGIAYLHAAKPPIVHGNISTRTLLIDYRMTTKVSDFWLSGPLSRKTPHSDTNRRMSLRFEEWVAPEVASGTVITPATDVWALGVVLWELFQGYTEAQPPAQEQPQGPRSRSSSASSTQMDYVTQHPEPNSSTPREVVELLFRCWESQPDQRPTIFDILRMWPSTFASVGHFELPSDLSQIQVTEDNNMSGMGPDAVVPVAMMSHSEQSATQSLHFEFPAPSCRAEASEIASQSTAPPSITGMPFSGS
eukprot:m51a1_g4938 putative serine threonine protein kinase (1249) ;mRNA; r:296879-300700